MTLSVLDAEAALHELETTSLVQIEHSTALAWGGRSLASYRLASSATKPLDILHRFQDGEAFRQEALEHAAMADDDGGLLATVQAELDAARRVALKAIEQAVAG